MKQSSGKGAVLLAKLVGFEKLNEFKDKGFTVLLTLENEPKKLLSTPKVSKQATINSDGTLVLLFDTIGIGAGVGPNSIEKYKIKDIELIAPDNLNNQDLSDKADEFKFKYPKEVLTFDPQKSSIYQPK
ncbi:hypothetical protein [Ureaplasma canigenitalium]|uniref:hypothetical protein n=1 Tax=Ureaplasma canigenitalium TaxID=42092 RepID=UPI0004E0EC18|nr:hypothetical protein [Ureaplasma canigenitalium]